MTPGSGAGESAQFAGVERVFIVGAGGFGREVHQWYRQTWPDRGRLLRGFLSADGHRLDGHGIDLGVVGTPEDAAVQRGDAFLLAIGIPGVRRAVAEGLRSRGARFLTLVHATAIVADTARLGAGTIVCPYAIVSANAVIGRCGLVNYHASLAHDGVLHDYVVLSPGAAIGGGAVLDDDVFVGLNGSVGPGRCVGARSKVAANSSALRDVPADCLALGIPAKISPLLGGGPGR